MIYFPVQGRLGCKGRVVHTLLLKCRDKDKRVQLSAYEQLASMDSKVLHKSMRPVHWGAILDGGLGAWDGAQLTQGKTPPRPCLVPPLRQVKHEQLSCPRHPGGFWRLLPHCSSQTASCFAESNGEHEHLEELREPVLALLKTYLTGTFSFIP